MKERPILFSAPMVRALLDGRKTQTRRVVKPQPAEGNHFGFTDGCLRVHTYDGLHLVRCPFGQPGDRLWVREAWRTYASLDKNRPSGINSGAGIQYEAGGSSVRGYDRLLGLGRLRPGMFMPRWASRITLEVTGVRVDRLQSISETDCCAEGCGSPITRDYKKPKFQALWESINGAESWAANPWVWAIEFRMLP